MATHEDSGRAKGWGTVEYSSPAEAMNAISSLSNTQLDGRVIEVREDREGKQAAAPERYERRERDERRERGERGDRYERGERADRYERGERNGGGGGFAADVSRVARRLYVGNLAYRTSWQDLKDHFKSCGNVVYADVMKMSDGRSKGCGIVEMDTHQEAVRALSMHDTELEGRPLTVREDREDRDLQ